jgi:hypothetical protein
MFNFFKKKGIERPKATYKFEWHDIGEGNPFNKRILDCRDFTQNNLATTGDKSIVETYTRLRRSDGKEYVTQEFKNKITIETALKYPPTGSQLTNLVFKAKSFDEKWDIYIHDSCFYFVRSWTGELVYKAFGSVDSNNVTIYKLELEDNSLVDKSIAVSHVHFLVSTQILKGIIPHRVPSNLKTDMEIALYSFSQFGNKCWYATYDDILDVVIKNKGGQT